LEKFDKIRNKARRTRKNLMVLKYGMSSRNKECGTWKKLQNLEILSERIEKNLKT
jgi:hypothetical protein